MFFICQQRSNQDNFNKWSECSCGGPFQIVRCNHYSVQGKAKKNGISEEGTNWVFVEGIMQLIMRPTR